MEKYNLKEILPHNYPMILIDELLDAGKNYARASVKITEDKIFYNKKIEGITPLAGIEFMAQTIACYAYFKNDKTAKIGFLLGSRNYKSKIEKFEKDKTYLIEAKEKYTDEELVSFECFIYNDGVELISAVVNVFQPKDIERFGI